MDADHRVVLIGLDGLLSGLMKRFRPLTPHTDRLLREGVFADALSCMPTDTPTNWTTIATGAGSRTHRVLGFPRGPNGKALAHFDSRRCQAEFVWEAVERAGKQTILLNYPTSWPVRTKRCTVVGGDGVFSPKWRIGDLVHYSTDLPTDDSSRAVLFDICRTDVRIQLQEASGWAEMPSSAQPALEARIPSVERKAASWSDQGFAAGEAAPGSVSGHYFLLVTADASDGYDTVIIAANKDASTPLCRLHVGEWSPPLFGRFAGQSVRGSFRFKLIELSADGTRLRLYRSMVSAAEGWTCPSSLAAELVEQIGPYHEGWENSPMEMAAELGVDTLVEHAQMQADWIAGAARHLAAREPWDLLMAQVHIQDSYNHRFLHRLEPLCAGYSKEGEAEAWSLFERLYRITDNMIGQILDACAGEDTTVIVLSDHGGFPCHTTVCVQGILLKAGLLQVRYDDATGAASIASEGSRQTSAGGGDWLGRTRARDEVLSALTAVRDPRTGLCPFALVMDKDDLPSLGPSAASASDVPFFLKAGYAAQPLPKTRDAVERMLDAGAFFQPCGRGVHQGLPTIRFKEFSNRATFIISGAGIRGGQELPAPIHLKDVTPTIAHLLGIDPPRQCEGRVLREVLAD